MPMPPRPDPQRATRSARPAASNTGPARTQGQALTTPAPHPQNGRARGAGMRFSANLGFLYLDLPFLARIGQAARDGFDAVECHFPYDVPVADTRAALRDAGIRMIAINTPPGDLGRGDFGLAALPGREAEAREAILRALDHAAGIGAGAVHVMAGKSGGGRAAEAVLRANLRLAAAEAALRGLEVLIEPINRRDVPGYHYASLAGAVRTIGAVGAENLRLM
ncbi:MAG: TIM barrel protein, partial [Alphaproteobacteria bacterium]|nr:TIM barrel protein [Alphaproteobacteria bacterium]